MYPPGAQVWLSTTAGEMLATVLSVQEHPAPPVYLVKVDGGPRMLAPHSAPLSVVAWNGLGEF
jgi:hypothetical protein